MVLTTKRIVYGDSAGKISIPKETGEAHRLLDVYIDAALLNFRDRMEIKVGTVGITSLPLTLHGTCFLTRKAIGTALNASLLQLIRKLFGEVYIEADEDEDITLQVLDSAGAGRDISGGSIAIYDVIPTGIDKTRLLCSGSENHIIAPFLYHDEAALVADKTVKLDNVLQMEGLPEVKDGYVVPAAMELELETLIADVKGTPAGGTSTFNRAKLHMKDVTFELFSPVKLYGVELNPKFNPLIYDAALGKYADTEKYVISAGHELSFTSDIDITYDGTNAVEVNLDLIPIALMRVLK